MVQTRSQRTITIQSLPRELLAHCLAFLPFAEAFFGIVRVKTPWPTPKYA